jgi:AcrR family transcriptional regulator
VATGYIAPIQPTAQHLIMQRDRTQTEQRLIEAVGQIIKESGFDQLGINRVASRAGVNKILIYRYFGGISGLIEAYYERRRPIVATPVLNVEQLRNASLDEIFNSCYEYIVNEYRSLRENVEARELLRANLLNNDGLRNPGAIEKEDQLLQMVDELASLIKTTNGRSFAAIIVSAMTLLTFMSQQKRSILGIDLNTDEGWEQIEGALKNIYRGAYLFTRERLDNLDKKVA